MPARGPATGWEGTHGAGSIREDGGCRRGQLNFGEILWAGTPAEIRAHPEVIAVYLGVTHPDGTGGPRAAGGEEPAAAPMDRV